MINLQTELSYRVCIDLENISVWLTWLSKLCFYRFNVHVIWLCTESFHVNKMTETSTIIRDFAKVNYGEAFSQGVADLFRKLYWIWRTGLCLTCHVNILKPKQNCRNFEDDVFTSVFITDKCCILINFTEVCVNGSNWLYVTIGLAKESAQWKRQSITCTTSHIDWITPMMLRPLWYLIIILLYNILQANNPTHEWKFLLKNRFQLLWHAAKTLLNSLRPSDAYMRQ